MMKIEKKTLKTTEIHRNVRYVVKNVRSRLEERLRKDGHLRNNF